ncbi:MAG: outer membrane biosynthesis protein TonB [Myxococcota bacterium]|jgi:outer membrane biosynthesis protein TonB
MFDTIGHTTDDDANQRRAAAAILLTVLFGGAVGLGLVVTAWTAQQVTDPTISWVEELYEPVVEPPRIEIELPSVPSPPPPQMALGEVPEPNIDPDPKQPDEMAPEVQDLTTPPDERVANNAPVVGAPDGVESGDPNGDRTGQQGGVENGTGERIGSLAAAIPTIHVRDVRMRRAVAPNYPDAARDMNLGQVDCRVRVLIDPDGRPADLTVVACPSVFHDEVRQAVQRTRWYPYKIGGETSNARFEILYRFQPHG